MSIMMVITKTGTRKIAEYKTSKTVEVPCLFGLEVGGVCVLNPQQTKMVNKDLNALRFVRQSADGESIYEHACGLSYGFEYLKGGWRLVHRDA